MAVARTGDGATATRTVRVHIGPRLPAHRQETARLFRHAL